MKNEGEMEVDNPEKIFSSTITPRRTKKKSTLAKLKERKLKELGSSTSLQKQNSEEATSDSPDGKSQPMTQAVESARTESEHARPHPKPRSRRPSTDQMRDTQTDTTVKSNSENSGERYRGRQPSSGSISDGPTLQRFKDLKMAGDSEDSLEPALSSFVPKPPTTPRTPRSNPRTPRGVSAKGEKRNREPTLSGDEVEQKKEKNHVSHAGKADINSASSNQLENGERVFSTHDSANGAMNFQDSCSVDESKRLSPHKKSHRLLKRRSLKETPHSNGTHQDSVEQGSQRDLGKPPINRSLTNLNSSTNSNNRLDNGAVFNHNNHSAQVPNIDGLSNDLSQFSSPRDKYLKSKNGSRSSSAHHRSPSSDSLIQKTDDKFYLPTDNETMIATTSTNQPHTPRAPPSPGRLQPLSSPRSLPPPLSEEFASHALRTSYKIDPDARPSTGAARTSQGGEKSDSGPPSTGDRLSQKSFQSVSVMQTITTQEARTRTFFESSINEASTSVSGADELERYFPERKVNIFVGTWNMNELKDFTISLDDFILPEKCEYVQDIYAIGTQENAMNKKEWEIKIQETLGPSHVMFHSVMLGSLHLVIYIRRDLIWFCSTPADDVISLRAVTMGKTKGAIAICFSLFGTSYLFINCHLTSDRDNDNTKKKSRLGEYNRVIQEMKFHKVPDGCLPDKKTSDITSIFDGVFWFGDLNFRIERKRHAVEGKVHQIASTEFRNFETLLGGDQLHKYMNEGKIFTGFQEGRINFHPTFKFDINKDTYDSSSKNRVPSYTDRIMFRSMKKHDITCLHYDAVMGIKVSDHRPVYGQYCTGIQPGKDNTVYCAGHFDRGVYLEANKRRAAKVPGSKRDKKKKKKK